jgi:hypothetical protein
MANEPGGIGKDVSLQRLSQPNVFDQPGGPKDPKNGNRSHRKAIDNQAERLVNMRSGKPALKAGTNSTNR